MIVTVSAPLLVGLALVLGVLWPRREGPLNVDNQAMREFKRRMGG